MYENIYCQTLSETDFNRLRKAVYDHSGINLTLKKKQMVEGRLRKRVKALGLSGYDEYFSLLFGNDAVSAEFVNLIDVITTNKTDFFREPDHFTFLADDCLPELLLKGKTVNVWSAACSTGEEAWSIAMTLSYLQEKNFTMDFHIYASDISTTVLRTAARAVYEEYKADSIPEVLKKKYLMRSKDRRKKLVRISPEVRSRVRFIHINLKKNFSRITGKMDIIFCRNVIIYFNRNTQTDILNRLVSHIRPGGYLFLGHSESIHGMELPVYQVRPTVFRKAA